MKSNKIINYNENNIEYMCCEQLIFELCNAQEFHIYEIIDLNDKVEYLINVQKRIKIDCLNESED